MSVADIMHKELHTVDPTQTVRQAAVLMKNLKIGALVVASGNKIIGMFTERDLLMKVTALAMDPDTCTLDQVMTKPVMTIGPDWDENEALKLMNLRHFRHLPVVNDQGVLLGMVGIRDLLMQYSKKLEDENKVLRKRFAELSGQT